MATNTNKGAVNPIGAIYSLFERLNGAKASAEYVERITNYLDENIVDIFTFPLDASRLLIQTAITARDNIPAQTKLIAVYSRLLTDTTFGTDEFFQLGQVVAIIADLYLTGPSADIFGDCKLELPFDDRILSPPKMKIKISSHEHFSALAVFWCSVFNKSVRKNGLRIRSCDYASIVIPIGNYLLTRKWEKHPGNDLRSQQIVFQAIEILSSHVLHEDMCFSIVSIILDFLVQSCSSVMRFEHDSDTGLLSVITRAINILASLASSAVSPSLISRIISRFSNIIHQLTFRKFKIRTGSVITAPVVARRIQAMFLNGLRRLSSSYRTSSLDIHLPSVDASEDALSFHSHCALTVEFVSVKLGNPKDFLTWLKQAENVTIRDEQHVLGKVEKHEFLGSDM